MQKKPKSINALMAYMRDEKGLNISGSSDKKKLRYMGYFHGYKGYRYHNNPANTYAFNSFDEVQAIYDFDMVIKTMFYPEIMFLETAFKNYVLEVILEDAKSKRFADIYAKLLPLIVYALKDLRNAVAHNNTIFDARFKTGKVSLRIAKCISAETGINNITFESIVDYVILISFMMKLLECPKKKIMAFIRLFEKNCEELRGKVSTSIFNTVVYTDTRTKLNLLKKYL